jgi:uncharacterized membrane protein HdeD (DUF308 family)
MRIIIFVSGLFPIAAGIFFLVNEGQMFVSLAFVAGIAPLALGIAGVLAYLVARRALGLPSWMQAESLLALLLAAVTLLNRIQDDDVALSVFGVWLMAAGAMRFAGGFNMSRETLGFRIALIVAGLLSALMGAYGFFQPFLPEIGISGMLGGIFIVQGVSVVAFGASISRKQRGDAANPANPTANLSGKNELT